MSIDLDQADSTHFTNALTQKRISGSNFKSVLRGGAPDWRTGASVTRSLSDYQLRGSAMPSLQPAGHFQGLIPWTTLWQHEQRWRSELVHRTDWWWVGDADFRSLTVRNQILVSYRWDLPKPRSSSAMKYSVGLTRRGKQHRKQTSRPGSADTVRDLCQVANRHLITCATNIQFVTHDNLVGSMCWNLGASKFTNPNLERPRTKRQSRPPPNAEAKQSKQHGGNRA